VTLRRARLLLVLGLGAIAGAVLPDAARAQVPVKRDTLARRDTAKTRVDTAGGKRISIPAGPDTIKVPTPPRADSMIRNDSIIKGIVPLPVVKADTIKAPWSRAELPVIIDIGPQRIYDRASLFATGALTLSDMLARVPGLTEYTTGFLAAPALIASAGDFRRVRIFLDGVELDPMDRRARGVAPINDLPLQTLEEVRIERGSDEVRVHARSWRVDRTVPFTRADIFTGDQSSNLYRAFFGRRYEHGETMQFSAEQFNTQPDSRLASSDGLSLMGRLGLTRGPWNADATAFRTSTNRAPWVGTGDSFETRDTVPQLAADRTTAYLRLANGDPELGKWFQAIASSHSYHGRLRKSTSVLLTPAASSDSLVALSDSSEYESQYVFTGGVATRTAQVSATERIRAGGHRTSHAMSARAAAQMGRLSGALFAEGSTYLSPGRAEATVRAAPLDRVAVVASASRTSAGDFDRLFTEPRSGVVLDESGQFVPTGQNAILARDTAEVTRYSLPARSNLRVEVGVRLRDLWLAGGVLKRGPTTLLPPAEIDSRYAARKAVVTEGEATARTLAARGRLWKAVNVDAWALAWNDSLGFYRPRYQTRGELYIQTNLLDRFPRGNFGLLASLAHEYRSASRFPISSDTVRTAPGYRLITLKLEIRVQTAVVSYQFRNLLQERYAQIPGYNLPRQTQFYGVRWDFWN